MNGEEAIPCPSGPGTPYIHGGQLHASPNEGTWFSQETLAMPPMHRTIHHGSPRIAPREISCFATCSDLTLRLSSLVQDGAATDCLHDATVSVVTGVAEDRYPPRRTSFGVRASFGALASFGAPPSVRLLPSVRLAPSAWPPARILRLPSAQDIRVIRPSGRRTEG